MKRLSHAAFALLLAVPFGTASAKKAPALADIIYDRSGFLERLPKKCLTYPLLMEGVPGLVDAEQAFNEAMHELGNPKGIEFFGLTSEFVRPGISVAVAPDYPAAKAGVAQAGHADFLVLIGRTGGVAALYCASATDRLFAIAGANALVRWTFSPAFLGKQPIPVLVMVRIRFLVDLNGIDHEG
jgi:hypothetical protein